MARTKRFKLLTSLETSAISPFVRHFSQTKSGQRVKNTAEETETRSMKDDKISLLVFSSPRRGIPGSLDSRIQSRAERAREGKSRLRGARCDNRPAALQNRNRFHFTPRRSAERIAPLRQNAEDRCASSVVYAASHPRDTRRCPRTRPN